jgi:hypothetical protein
MLHSIRTRPATSTPCCNRTKEKVSRWADGDFVTSSFGADLWLRAHARSTGEGGAVETNFMEKVATKKILHRPLERNSEEPNSFSLGSALADPSNKNSI